MSDAENLEISRFNKLWVKKKKFCTQASRSRNPNRYYAAHITVQQFFYKHNKLNQIFNVKWCIVHDLQIAVWIDSAADAALEVRRDALVLYFGGAVGVMRHACRGEMAPDRVRLH